MSIKNSLRIVAGMAGMAFVVGCGSGPGHPDLEKQTQEQNNAKVEAAKAIADAVEKDDKQALAGALEVWRSTPFSASGDPKAAEQIAEIYKTRIQPKAKGDAAALDAEMRAVIGKK